jgi:hypothetical protein
MNPYQLARAGQPQGQMQPQVTVSNAELQTIRDNQLQLQVSRKYSPGKRDGPMDPRSLGPLSCLGKRHSHLAV